MLKFILRRLINLIPTLLGVTIVVFSAIHLAPGDPITLMAGEEASEETIQIITRHYGLDQPLHIQYFRWIGNVVQGNFGTSIRQGRPVAELILGRLPASIELAIVGIFIGTIIAIPLGILAATKRGTWVDIGSMVAALTGVSIPNFWMGLLLLTFVALPFAYFPLYGRDAGLFSGLLHFFSTGSLREFYDGIRYLILPSITLGTAGAAVVTRLTRSSLLDVLKQDYITTARAKGLSERVVIYKHALKNALMPVVTVIGLRLAATMGGAIVTEVVFSWPGVGRLIVDAISWRDFPVVQAGVLMIAMLFTGVNLIVDVSYGFLNPKIRFD